MNSSRHPRTSPANINRRQFIHAVGGLSLGALAFPTILSSSARGADGAVAPANRVTLGVIGTGNQAGNDMRAFLGDNRVQIVAVCDVNKESAGYWDGAVAGREPARRLVEGHYAKQKESSAWKGVSVYEDFRELLAPPDIDCVLSRQPAIAPCEVAHRSITLAHLGNIAMQLGRDLKWDEAKEQIVGDAEANKMLRREYRVPWVLPG